PRARAVARGVGKGRPRHRRGHHRQPDRPEGHGRDPPLSPHQELTRRIHRAASGPELPFELRLEAPARPCGRPDRSGLDNPHHSVAGYLSIMDKPNYPGVMYLAPGADPGYRAVQLPASMPANFPAVDDHVV